MIKVELRRKIQRLRAKAGFLGRFQIARAGALLASSSSGTVQLQIPEVTVCIVNHHSENALLLLLSTMRRTLRYPKWHLIIANNTPTVRSRRLLDSVRQWYTSPKSVTIWEISTPVHHAVWLDRFMNESDTPYWIHLDSDIFFFRGDCVYDLISVMQSQPNCGLLSAEAKPASYGFREPFGGVISDSAEGPSTWLMAGRREIRERLSSRSFAVAIDRLRERPLIHDTGARLIAALQSGGMHHSVMPSWFRRKYYHFGSLSWFRDYMDSSSQYFALKEVQVAWITRQVRRRFPEFNYDVGDCPC